MQSELITVPGVEIGEELGRGAATVVYRARRGGDEYAVKVLRSVGSADEATAFRREAAMLACLHHQGLIRIHEAGQAAGHPYLIMDLIGGQPLTGLLRERGRLTEDQAAVIGQQVTQALAVAHEAGLVHRDIKPDNLMIGDDGRAQVIDFGLAARAGGEVADTAVGTFRYSAPEQTGTLHRAVDGRADLYGLGVVLFECLAGRTPFSTDDVGELIRMHLSVPAPDLRDEGVSPALAAVVAKLLAKDPDDRYQSAPGLAADLARIADGAREPFPLGTGEVLGGVDPTLVGRAAQTAQLTGRWRRTLTDAGSTRGGIVLVEGAPGSGKSRLVRELTALAGTTGHLVLHGKSTRDDAVPLAPLRALVDEYVARAVTADRTTAAELLRTAAGPSAPLLRAVSPALADLLDAPDAGHEVDERQFAEAVGTLLLGLAETAGGAVLHLDDLQWWDEGTRRVLRQLAPRLADAPLLVVLTARDDEDSRAALAAFRADFADALDLELEVTPLDRQGIDALIADQLGGGSVPADLVDRIATRSGGSPLAVREYVRAVIDAGLIQPCWGAWQVDTAGLDALALPDDVMELVVRRVDTLGPASRELLGVAALIGNRFQPDIVARAVAGDPATVLAVFVEAAGRHLVEATADGGFAFLHDRIREALLEHLDPLARRSLHQRIAGAYEQADGADAHQVYAVARHYLAGETDRDPAATFAAATAAGRQALADHAPADAVEFLRQADAVATAANLPTSAEFHTALAFSAARTAQYTLSDQHFERALAAETDKLRRARLQQALAESYHQRWQGERAVEITLRGLAELDHPVPDRPVLLFLLSLMYLLAGFVIGRLPERVRLVHGRHREVVRLRCKLMATGVQAAATAMRHDVLAALTLLAVPLARRLPRGGEYAVAEMGIALLTRLMGLVRPGRRILPRAFAAAQSTGDPGVIAHVAWMRGVWYDIAPPMHATTGRALRQACDAYGPAMDTGEFLTFLGAIGQTQILRGHADDVAALYRRGTAAAQNPQESLGSVFATIGAQAAALSGDPARAAALLREITEFVDGLAESLSQRTNLAVAVIQAAVEEGEVGEPLDRAIDDFAALPVNPNFMMTPQRPLWVYQAFGRLAQVVAAPAADRQRRLDQARQAVRQLRKMAGGPLLKAYHAAAAASLLQVCGDHAGAIGALARLQPALGGLDVPLLHYEIARVRARALQALGHQDDARREAGTALALATAHGWQTRARWMQVEFGLEVGRASSQTHTRTARRDSGSTVLGGPGSPHQLRRLTALHEVSVAASTVLDPGQLARVALDEMVRIFGAERAFLFLVDAHTERLEPYLGRDTDRSDLRTLTGYGSTLVERVRHSGEAIVVTGTEQGAALGSQSTLVHGLRSIMVVPLAVRGRLLGVVYLDSRAARGIFTTDDVDILGAITNLVATSLETARAAQLELAVRTAERERDIAESLRAAMGELAGNLDPGEVEATLARRVAAALPGSAVRVVRRDAGGGLVGGELDGSALDDELPSATHGRLAEKPLPPILTRLLPAGGDGWLVVPMRVRGEDRGLVLATRPDRGFSDTEAQVAAALGEQGAVALDNALLFHKVRDLATRDALTGLYNRRQFFELADGHVNARNRRPLAAIMIDIDHFKAVNDTHGHPVGDAVICEVARRLSDTVRDSDILCRYGGEEFAVLLIDTADTGPGVLADRLLAAVAAGPVATDVGPLPITVSVGLAAPSVTEDLGTILNRADQALYRAKRGGRNQVAVDGEPPRRK